MAHLRIQEGQYTQTIYGLVRLCCVRMVGKNSASPLSCPGLSDQGAELWRGGADPKLRAAEPSKSKCMHRKHLVLAHGAACLHIILNYTRAMINTAVVFELNGCIFLLQSRAALSLLGFSYYRLQDFQAAADW